MGRSSVVKKANALHPTVSLDALAAKMREPGFSLPNLANLFATQSLACFAANRSSEFRHIRERPVAAEARQRMRVGVGHQPREFESFVRAPHLRPAQEKTLLGSKAVLVRRARLALQRLFIGGVGDGQTAEIGDAFAEHQLAILVEIAAGHLRPALAGDPRHPPPETF